MCKLLMQGWCRTRYQRAERVSRFTGREHFRVAVQWVPPGFVFGKVILLHVACELLSNAGATVRVYIATR
jgi:hypothetical protein